MAIFRLVQAAIAGACWQLCLIVLVLLSVKSFAMVVSHNHTNPGHWLTDQDAFATPATLPFLTWVYVLSSLGVALTRTRFTDITSAQLKRASRTMYPLRPGYAARILMVPLTVAAIGCLIVALRPPPQMLVELCQHAFGVPLLAPVVWSGALSVMAAGLGANAHAAIRAAQN